MNTVSRFASDSKNTHLFYYYTIVLFSVAVAAWFNLNNRFVGIEDHAVSTQLLTSLDKLRVHELSFSNERIPQSAQLFYKEAELSKER